MFSHHTDLSSKATWGKFAFTISALLLLFGGMIYLLVIYTNDRVPYKLHVTDVVSSKIEPGTARTGRNVVSYRLEVADNTGNVVSVLTDLKHEKGQKACVQTHIGNKSKVKSYTVQPMSWCRRNL